MAAVVSGKGDPPQRITAWMRTQARRGQVAFKPLLEPPMPPWPCPTRTGYQYPYIGCETGFVRVHTGFADGRVRILRGGHTHAPFGDGYRGFGSLNPRNTQVFVFICIYQAGFKSLHTSQEEYEQARQEGALKRLAEFLVEEDQGYVGAGAPPWASGTKEERIEAAHDFILSHELRTTFKQASRVEQGWISL